MSDSLIAEIQTKLDRLRNLDRQFAVFGSATHKYHLNPCLSESELQQFEAEYGVKLPEDYRHFLKYIGNGGAGPDYCFLSLQGDRDVSRPFLGRETLMRQQIALNWQADREILIQYHGDELSSSLEITELDRISTQDLLKFAARIGILETRAKGELYECYPDLLDNDDLESLAGLELWDVSVTGFIPLFECGCGHRNILIVNGKEYGRVMTFSDTDRWLSDSNQTFSQYYLTWLDEHLHDFDRCLELMNRTRSVQDIERTMYLERMSARESGERHFPGSGAMDLIASLINVTKPPELFGYPGQILVRAGQTEWAQEQLRQWRHSRLER